MPSETAANGVENQQAKSTSSDAAVRSGNSGGDQQRLRKSQETIQPPLDTGTARLQLIQIAIRTHKPTTMSYIIPLDLLLFAQLSYCLFLCPRK